MSDSATPWTVGYQAPPSMEFSRQEYWSGFPFPSSGDLPDPGIEPGPPILQEASLPSEPPDNQGDNIQPWHTPFPTWNKSVVPCPVLTVASWPITDFSRGRSGGLVFPCLEEFFTVCCDPHKGFGIVSKAEVDVFLEFLLHWWSNRCWQFDLWFLCLF